MTTKTSDRIISKIDALDEEASTFFKGAISGSVGGSLAFITATLGVLATQSAIGQQFNQAAAEACMMVTLTVGSKLFLQQAWERSKTGTIVGATTAIGVLAVHAAHFLPHIK